jgi:hypothetical protein
MPGVSTRDAYQSMGCCTCHSWHGTCESGVVNSNNELDAAAIADEILGYLRTHPQAADTLEGVVQWWLIQRRYLRGLAQVQAALALLIERGLVVERIGADATRLYSAADERTDG